MTMTAPVAPAVDLSRLCDWLLRADPDIVEIVLFGSAAYAPDLAKDVDVVVTTRAKKADDVYWDAVAAFDTNVDVLVREPGQPMGRDIALSVFAVGRSLYGDGATAREARNYMAAPTYEEARTSLTIAAENLEMGRRAVDAYIRDQRYRGAFDSLSDAARYAAMAFLSTENTKWGELPRQLPAPFDQQFRPFIAILHVQFHYDGKYPKDTPDEEFTRWRDKVSQFIADLENESKKEKPTQSEDEDNT